VTPHDLAFPVPAVVAIVVTVVGLLFALLTARFSLGPGWRELREYSTAAAFGAAFTATTAVNTMAVTPDTLRLASRVGLLFAALHGAAWFAYSAAQERRAWTRVDRLLVGAGLAVGVAALVPGVIVSDVVSVRPIAWLGVVYRDAVPTPLGAFGFSIYCIALVVLTYRYWRRWRHGVPYAAAHFFGLGALLIAAVNDSLTAAQLYDAPYMLDLGFLTAIGCVGGALTARFVASARSLDEQGHTLRATQAALVQRERLAALGELSAVVAHEVRNPIGIIFNAIAVLRRSPRDSRDADTLLEIVDEEAQRLIAMVNDLLAFASPGRLRITKTSLDAILSGAAEAAHASAPPGSPGVHVHVSPAVPPVECDEQLVRQAVINLITNGMQASPGEVVEVLAELDPEDPTVVRIAVKDRGHGVPAEAIPRLFTPFFTTRPTGTGLGLAIVRRVAEAHGGEVRVVPSGGPGATFWLKLPLETPRHSTISPTADTLS